MIQHFPTIVGEHSTLDELNVYDFRFGMSCIIRLMKKIKNIFMEMYNTRNPPTAENTKLRTSIKILKNPNSKNKNKRSLREIITVIIFFSQIYGSNCYSINASEDIANHEKFIIAVEGDKVTLPCTSDTPVDWDWRGINNVLTHIYWGNSGFVTNDSRYQLYPSASKYDLDISEVKLQDAGIYVCTTKSGQGESWSIKLIITGKLFCNQTHGSYGDRFFGIEKQNVSVSCSMPCVGFQEHLLRCHLKNLKDQSLSIAGGKIGPNLCGWHASLEPKLELHGELIECQVSAPNQSKATSAAGHSWISSPLTIRYASLREVPGNLSSHGCDIVRNYSSCNPPCHYEKETRGDDCYCVMSYLNDMHNISRNATNWICDGVEKDSSDVVMIVATCIGISLFLLIVILCFLWKCSKFFRPKNANSPGDSSGAVEMVAFLSQRPYRNESISNV